MIKQILLGPHITEKSMASSPEKKYIFEVDPKANKAEIAKAVSDAYKVNVLAVKTVSMKGKFVRYRQRFAGKRKDFKKAIVSIDKKQTIKEFSVKE